MLKKKKQVLARTLKATRTYVQRQQEFAGIRASPGVGTLQQERYPEVYLEQEGNFLTAIS